MRLDVQSDNWLLQTGGTLVNAFKDAFLLCWKPILNIAFPPMANSAIKIVQDYTRGDVNAGIIQTLVDILPANDIHIPEGIHISYEMADDNRARIENGRAYGYFKGDIMGLPEDQWIREPEYNRIGDLGLTS